MNSDWRSDVREGIISGALRHLAVDDDVLFQFNSPLIGDQAKGRGATLDARVRNYISKELRRARLDPVNPENKVFFRTEIPGVGVRVVRRENTLKPRRQESDGRIRRRVALLS